MEQLLSTNSERKKKWRKDNPEKYLRLNRENSWRRAGIDVKLATFLREEKINCAICNSQGNLHVDHCHETLKIRDMLCDQCNRGIGLFKHSSNLLREAAKYLDNHEEPV